MNRLWFGKSLQDAIAAPILFVDSETAVNFEPKFDEVNMRKTLQSDIQAPKIKTTKRKGQNNQ